MLVVESYRRSIAVIVSVGMGRSQASLLEGEEACSIGAADADVGWSDTGKHHTAKRQVARGEAGR